jgi:hypothetical protein
MPAQILPDLGHALLPQEFLQHAWVSSRLQIAQRKAVAQDLGRDGGLRHLRSFAKPMEQQREAIGAQRTPIFGAKEQIIVITAPCSTFPSCRAPLIQRSEQDVETGSPQDHLALFASVSPHTHHPCLSLQIAYTQGAPFGGTDACLKKQPEDGSITGKHLVRLRLVSGGQPTLLDKLLKGLWWEERRKRGTHPRKSSLVYPKTGEVSPLDKPQTKGSR